jgi:cardiolipin synthase
MMAALKSLFQLSLVVLIFSSCSHFNTFNHSIVDELIVTPDPKGHQQIIDSILKAKNSVLMKMYHLTDSEVINALLKAHNKKINLKIILDSGSLQQAQFKRSFEILRNAGIDVRGSSTCFSITHEKSLIVDSKIAFITSMNLTRSFAETRDFGVITTNQEIVKEMNDVFIADWQNTTNNTCQTPVLSAKNLIWSPVNAEEKLVDLIRSAHNSIYSTVENLGNKKIEQALTEMASQGVEIKMIVPQCDKNKNPLFNYPFISKLALGNIDVRVMPHPSSKERPYMHSKMILVDENRAYIGSINFSNNYILRSRELGIVFNDEDAIQKLDALFRQDWRVSIPPVPLKQDFCPELN